MYAAETVVRIGPQRFDYRAPERFILLRAFRTICEYGKTFILTLSIKILIVKFLQLNNSLKLLLNYYRNILAPYNFIL